MVEEVNKIIYNMLISGRGVHLPDVGTLFIERQGARRIDDRRLLSPRNVVSFSSQESAPSLVDEIVSIAGCSQEQAQDIYERWISKTRQQGEVQIGGVGVLRGKSFVADKAFATAINPKGVKTLVVRRKNSHVWIYALCGVAIIVALAFFAYLQWGEQWGVGQAPKAESVATAVTPSANEAQGEASGDAIDEQATTPSSVATTAATTTPAASKATTAGAYRYYVVMGVFSTEQNAARAVEQVRSKIKDVECEVLPFHGKFMVTPFGSDSRSECNLFIRSYGDIYPDLWVYNIK